MRRLLLAVFIILIISSACYAHSYLGTKIGGTITTGSSLETFPTVWEDEINGGAKVATDIASRDAIPVQRRVEGMICFVLANTTEYRLLLSAHGGVNDDLADNVNWIQVTAEGTGGGSTGPTGPAGPMGATGPAGGGSTGPISAEAVSYTNSSYSLPNVQAALDYLLPPPPNTEPSVSLSSSIGHTLYGTTITSTPLHWSISLGSGVPYGISVETQTIDHGVGAVTPTSLRDATDNVTSYASQHTYNISVLFGSGATKTSSVTVPPLYYWERYYGASSTDINAMGNSDIYGLAGKEEATSPTKASVTITPSGSQWLYYCYPHAWGTATFTVLSALWTGWTSREVTSFVNETGNGTYGACDYVIWRSQYQYSTPLTFGVQ